jgi:hypothetical protein
MLDAQFHFPRCNHGQDIGRAALKFFMSRDVMNQGGTRDEEGPFL